MKPFAYLCAAFGMAPLLALFRRDGAAILFESASGSPYGSRLGYFLFLGLACIGACVWLSLGKRHPSARIYCKDPRLVVGVSAAATLIAGAFVLFGGVDGTGVVGTAAVCIGFALWAVVIVPVWGGALAAHKRTPIMCAVVLALLASLLPSTVGAFVNGALKPLVALGPLAAGVLLVLGFRDIVTGPAASGTAAESAEPERPAQDARPRGGDTVTVELRRFPLFFSALVLLGGVIRGFLNNGAFINSHDPANNLTTHVVSAVLVTCVFCIAARCERTSVAVRRAGGLLFMFLLGSLLLIAFLSVELAPMLPLGRSLVIAGNTCLTALFWALLVFVQQEAPHRDAARFELYVVAEALASFCSYLFTPAFAQYLGISLENQVFGCSLATAFVLAVAAFAFLGNGETGLDDRQAAEAARSPLETCQELAPRYGLTEREVQICALLAQGHTLDAVADRLGLSANTVRSYSKDLYRKLGVHKKQEVVELVGRAGEEAGAR